MEPTFFETQEQFRAWLEQNHLKETELLVGFYKTGSGRPSMTWPQSVDQALCFGWIDGVRKSRNAESYTIRFTPRKATSIWSAVNIKKVEELTAKGLMQPAGLAAYEKREEKRSMVYAYESGSKEFSKAYEEQFKAEVAAWDFFQSQAPWYKKVAVHRVMSAKQEKTQQSRLKILIEASKAGKRWEQ
ncbi:bacteriocin-protection protein [Mucilaginibacter terrenus]|uniref:Bacteriocin-protection protein n=1 Tax=Mucilaginibacter terrenus TaxID=2482727 RepID=A0A3E2NX37_9SPHI|nr:YdeI/OmpD-associated family protein [Mucilaginibacter terrenus]RFZ85586.1 bacteriocin-protection protein [Mucilaginibacter terrenus]